MNERIPMDQMEARRIYRLQSRNLLVGVWNPDTHGFIGIREKFGDKYLFTEYHYEYDPHVGTASPLKALDLIPEGIPLMEYLRDDDRTLRTNPALFELLGPYDRAAQEQLRLRYEAEDRERESLRYKPQSKDEYEKAQRFEAANEWRREQMKAGKTWGEVVDEFHERCRAPKEDDHEDG